MMPNHKAKFKQAVKKAKQLYKTGKYNKFSDAVKAAWGKMGTTKKANRQTGSSVKKRDKARKAKPPGKRISKSKQVYYERRKNRSDKPGTVSGAKAFIRQSLSDRMKRLLYLKEMATTKTSKRQYAKEIRALKNNIKLFQ